MTGGVLGLPWTQERKPRLLAIASLLALQDPGLVRSEVAQLCVTLHNPMDCSLPGSSVHGILQARVLEWVAMPLRNIVAKTNDLALGNDFFKIISKP